MISRGYLLDTNVFIWLMEKSPRLRSDLFIFLKNPQTTIFLSVASIWEIILKRVKKPLRVPRDLIGGIEAAGFVILPIQASHVMGVEELPLHHKDPFDRILISQSKVENLILITSDPKIWKYNTSILKC